MSLSIRLGNWLEERARRRQVARYNRLCTWCRDNGAEWATLRHPVPANANRTQVKNITADLLRDLGFSSYGSWERGSW